MKRAVNVLVLKDENLLPPKSRYFCGLFTQMHSSFKSFCILKIIELVLNSQNVSSESGGLDTFRCFSQVYCGSGQIF